MVSKNINSSHPHGHVLTSLFLWLPRLEDSFSDDHSCSSGRRQGNPQCGGRVSSRHNQSVGPTDLTRAKSSWLWGAPMVIMGGVIPSEKLLYTWGPLQWPPVFSVRAGPAHSESTLSTASQGGGASLNRYSNICIPFIEIVTAWDGMRLLFLFV